MKPRIRSRILWTLAATEMLIVFTIMPFLVEVQKFLAANLGENLGHMPELALGLLASIIVVLIFKNAGQNRVKVALWLAAMTVVLLLSFKYMTQFPIERFHYLEYTTLSTLIYFAWRDRSNRKKLFFKTLILAALIALCEEGTQAFIPTRSCNLADVKSNLLGVCYGLVLSKTVIEAALSGTENKNSKSTETAG